MSTVQLLILAEQLVLDLVLEQKFKSIYQNYREHGMGVNASIENTMIDLDQWHRWNQVQRQGSL